MKYKKKKNEVKSKVKKANLYSALLQAPYL